MLEAQIDALLDAGVHFGHKKRRWNPKMAGYIFGERNGVHILDLHKTLAKMTSARDYLRELSAGGGKILFVGTKRQAQEIMTEAAQSCGAFYVSQRWLGGMLTNFTTIRKSVDRLKKLEAAREDGTHDRLPKKEVVQMEKERTRLEQNLGGIREMSTLPSAIFIVDTIKERTAVLEARRLGIPIVAVVDSNCDPDCVDHVIPGNDDATRSIKYLAAQVASAVTEGKALAEKRQAEKLAASVRRMEEKKEASETATADAPAETPSKPGIRWEK